MSDQYRTLSFPTEIPEAVRKELQALVSQSPPEVPVDIRYDGTQVRANAAMTFAVDPNNVHPFYFIRRSPDLFELHVSILNATLGGTASNVIWIRIPEGRKAYDQEVFIGHGADNGTWQELRLTTTSGDGWIAVLKSGFGNWTPGAGCYIGFQATIRLLPAGS